MRWFDYTGSPCLTNSNWDQQLHAKQHSHKKAMSHDCTNLIWQLQQLLQFLDIVRCNITIAICDLLPDFPIDMVSQKPGVKVANGNHATEVAATILIVSCLPTAQIATTQP